MPFKKFILPSIILILVFFAALIGYAYLLSQPLSSVSDNPNSVTFVVPRGQAVSTIASRLQEEQLIRSALVFRLVVKQHQLEDKLQAGSFQLSSIMTPLQIAEALTQGTNDLWVTIPEGWRREEIAQALADNQELTAFDQLEFLQLTKDKEGQLFPDTYLFARESTAQTIANALQTAFKAKVTTVFEKEIAQSQLSLNQILTLASIVEREARGAEEMREVAGILYNRLEIGMALQTDATLQYIKGYNSQKESWWAPPLAADKKLESPFNTYLHSGLPPFPICNPGLNAIKAVLNPLKTDDFYYLHDTKGELHSAVNLEAHNANIIKYLR